MINNDQMRINRIRMSSCVGLNDASCRIAFTINNTSDSDDLGIAAIYHLSTCETAWMQENESTTRLASEHEHQFPLI